MRSLTAIVLGATGLIGGQLVERLLNDNDYEKVRILVRRPVELTHKKLEVQVVNFDSLVDFRPKLGSGDCIFCCICTTQKQVKGDKTAYRKVDFDIPVNAAKMGKDACCIHCYYSIVSKHCIDRQCKHQTDDKKQVKNRLKL